MKTIFRIYYFLAKKTCKSISDSRYFNFKYSVSLHKKVELCNGSYYLKNMVERDQTYPFEDSAKSRILLSLLNCFSLNWSLLNNEPINLEKTPEIKAVKGFSSMHSVK